MLSKKPSEREFFVPAGTDLAVKLLKIYIIHPGRAMAEAALTTALLLHAHCQRAAAALREERNLRSSGGGFPKISHRSQVVAVYKIITILK